MRIPEEDEKLFIRFLACTACERYVELRTYANTLPTYEAAHAFRKNFVEKSNEEDEVIEKLSKLKLTETSIAEKLKKDDTLQKTRTEICGFVAWKGQKRERKCNKPVHMDGRCKNHLRK